jgi:BR serine/threonine kinase
MLPICYLLLPLHCYQVRSALVQFHDVKLFIIVVYFAGNIRRFRRICEHIQAQVCSKRYPTAMSSPQAQKPNINAPQTTQPQQTSPQPMCTSSNSTAASAESISCGSADSSDRLSYRERQNDTESEVETFFDCNTTMVKPRRSSASSNKSKNSDDGSCTPSIKSVSSR